MRNVFYFGSGYRMFCWPWFRHWLQPDTYYRPFVHAYQRVTRGWADSDTWNLDDWLCEVLPPAIEHLKAHTHGYPCELTEEEWGKILSEVAEGFRAIERSKDVPDRFITELDTSTGWAKDLGVKDREYDWDGIFAYQASEREKFEQSMKLFVKYFQSFWD